ncbi:6-phosphogluconolactonase [Conyzicola nivalis]|uniref:6-phosphogluconolactonase n=1 Tax=Conyzicola nivalis TaxID=1477021 RepID=A0ABV2QKX1_9MICO
MAVAFYVGAYTADMGGTATGIAALGRLADGSLENLGLATVADSPSYLATSGDLVYAAAEAAGRVEVFRRDSELALEPVAGAPSGGVAPCHVARYGDTVVAACYVDGTLGVLSAEPLALTQRVEAHGAGPHPAQDGPHAHATFALDGTTILSADLGSDRVHVHELANGHLTRTASLDLPPGTGPRDFLRLPSGLLLVLGELSLEVLVLRWNDGELSIVGGAALAGAEPGDHASALSLGPGGRFAYAGLRGSNRISILAVDGETVTAAGFVDAGGDWPRHHVVDGDVMHVAHERSSTVASFRLGTDGVPALIAPAIAVASPIFLLAV